MNEIPYPRIIPERKSGQERFLNDAPGPDFSLLEFWQWFASDLMSNATRGVLAEFIVAKALGIDTTIQVRDEWGVWDLTTPDGIKVEVKSSGYLQAWGQRALSKPVFGIAATRGWSGDPAVFDKDPKHHADVYVFCLFKHLEQDSAKPTANPMDLTQWDFYVAPTTLLNKTYPNAKSLGLRAVQNIAKEPVKWEELREKVRDCGARPAPGEMP